MQQPAGVEIEDDPWHETKKGGKVVAAAQKRTYEKLYREVMLGGGLSVKKKDFFVFAGPHFSGFPKLFFNRFFLTEGQEPFFCFLRQEN